MNKKKAETNKSNEKADEETLNFEIPLKKMIFIIVLGIGLILFFFVWEDVKINAGIILGDEIAEYQKECRSQCESGNKELFCCSPKGIYIGEENIVYTCQDEKLDIKCELDCTNVCNNLCKNIGVMLDCARAGCTWSVTDYSKTSGGYCRAKENT